MKSARDTRRREVISLLRSAAAGSRSPELLEGLRTAYLQAGKSERSKITRRLDVAGFPGTLINQGRGIER